MSVFSLRFNVTRSVADTDVDKKMSTFSDSYRNNCAYGTRYHWLARKLVTVDSMPLEVLQMSSRPQAALLATGDSLLVRLFPFGATTMRVSSTFVEYTSLLVVA